MIVLFALLATFMLRDLDHILRNPIYCGLIRFGEQQFKGAHQALIEESLYRKVQSVSGIAAMVQQGSSASFF